MRTEFLKTGPIPLGHIRPKRIVPICDLCGEEYGTDVAHHHENMAKHMVEKHGFVQVGAQVFKRRVCVACSKPGLYKVGTVAYCKEHVGLSKEKVKWHAAHYDAKSASITHRLDREEAYQRRIDSVIHKPKP